MNSSKSFRYAVAGRTVALHPVGNAVGVQFDDTIPTPDRVHIAESSAAVGSFRFRYEVPAERFTIYRLPQPSDEIPYQASTVMDRLSGTEAVRRTNPVFALNDKRVMPTDRLLVKCVRLHHEQELASLGLTVIENLDETLVCHVPEEQDPLVLANHLASLEWVEYVEPDFVTIGSRLHMITGEQFSPSSIDPLQYAVTITQTDRAWALQKGNPNVRIAILDDGMDIRHEDLASAVTATFDAISGSAFASINPWDSHGTRCAGIAAAIHENEVGIQGIGGGCSLMMVRIASTPHKGAPWATTSTTIRRGIDWAVGHGADVLNCSWGGSAPSSLITEALENARTSGRSGRGCVIVAAAGNASGPVDFPGSLRGVLTASGTNEYDEFKTRNSRDGEHWWGSNYGPEVDIAAPAVHIHTTDISGSGGVSPGDYIDSFNGTSAATPIVAGAAALLLSADSDLTERDVRQLLTDSADKIETYTFSGGRNDRLGYGRLNVYRALQQIRRPDNQMTGVIRQAGVGQPKAGAFYLDRNGESSCLLRTHAPDASEPADELAEQDLATLSTFAGKPVRIHYTRLQETPYGLILWGVDVQTTPEDGRQKEDTIPPGEVRLENGGTRRPEQEGTIPPGEVRLGWTEQPPAPEPDEEEEIPPNEVHMGFIESA